MNSKGWKEMKRLFKLVTLFLVLAMAFSLFACGKSDTKTESPGSGNGSNNSSNNDGGQKTSGDDEWVSYTVGLGSYLGRFLAGINPAECLSGCDAIFDTVFRPDPKTKEIFSYVLKNWYWEDDVTLICEMRDDIYFSNGDNATAEDLIFSYFNHVERGSNYLNDFGMVWEETVARDKYTAQFKLAEPYPGFINAPFYLIDKAWSQEVGWDSMEWYKPVGSGPYYVHEYVADSHIVLRSRGDDYWRNSEDPILVDEWILRYYPDESTLYMALEIGDVDFCWVSSANYSRFVQTGGDGYEVKISPDGTTFYFVHSLHPADGADYWLDKRLREATAIGINWEDVGKLAMGDMYIKAYSVVPADSPDFINPGQYEYNPDRARQLMIEAGYGPDKPLRIYTSTMDNPMNRNAFESFMFQAADIYIDAHVDFKDVSAALGDWLNPGNTDYGFFYNETGSTTREVRASVFDAYTPEGVTYTYIPFPELLDKFQVLLRSTDPAKVSEAGKWIQQFMFDEFLYIPIFETVSAVGWRTDKFTEAQIMNFRVYSDNYQLSRLGLASAWK